MPTRKAPTATYEKASVNRGYIMPSSGSFGVGGFMLGQIERNATTKNATMRRMAGGLSCSQFRTRDQSYIIASS